MSSKAGYAYTDDQAGDDLPRDAPEGQVNDPSYVTRQNEAIPVQRDEESIEDPVNAENADSDEQLARDDKDAIDEDNIIDERTRGAKPTGTYQEPSDEV